MTSCKLQNALSSLMSFVLIWLIMRCKLWPEHAVEAGHSRQHDPKCRLKSRQVNSIYFNHPSHGNSTNYYIILSPRDKAAPPTSQQIKELPPKASEVSSDIVIQFLFYFFHIHRRVLCFRPVRDKVRRLNRANIPRTC